MKKIERRILSEVLLQSENTFFLIEQEVNQSKTKYVLRWNYLQYILHIIS
jgi:hypothetical protein